MLDPHTLRMHFTEDVLVMIKDFPALAGEFLSTIGLVRVDTDQGYDHDLTQLPASGFIGVGSEHVSLNRRLWSDLADSGELETLDLSHRPLVRHRRPFILQSRLGRSALPSKGHRGSG